MAFLDWVIVIGFLVFLVYLANKTRHYTNSVVNFLAAGRCAGRYVIAIAEGIAGWGAFSCAIHRDRFNFLISRSRR